MRPVHPTLWKDAEQVLSGVLKKCLQGYGILWKPTVKYCCTVQIGRRIVPGISHGLNVLCDYYGIGLDHHKADSDSHACAEILLRYFESGADERSFIIRFRPLALSFIIMAVS